MNVKRIVERSVEKGTVTSGLFPFVPIKTTSIKEMLNINEIIIPASVAVTSIADAIPDKYSDQITILIREREGDRIFNYLDCSRVNQEPEPDQHNE